MSKGSPRGRTRRFFGGISVATRISAAVVIVSLLSLLIATVIGLRTGKDLGEDLYEDQIRAMRSSGSFDVTAYLNSLESTVDGVASSPQAAIAVEQLSEGLDELEAGEVTDIQERVELLATTYQEQFLEPLGEAGQSIDVRDVISEDNLGAVYLQSTYSVGFEPLARAAVVDDARDGSAWSATHSTFHPAYRQISRRLGIFDILLVDTQSGRIVYSVEKRPDLGANVDVGPISGSIVSTLTDQIRDDPDGGVVAADFRRYNPALLTPLAGVAAPILDDAEQLVGALIFLFDSSELTRILTADEDWNEAAFPTGGDLYLIGEDSTTRSEPRGFLEDRGSYLDAAETAGQLNEEDRQVVAASDTTVLILQATDDTVTAAEDDDDGVELRKTIDGRQAFSSVAQIPYSGFVLEVVAEVDSSDAQTRLDDFESLLIVGVAIFVVILAFLAVSWSISILRPVRSLSDRLAVGAAESDEPIEVPDRSPIEFHRLASRFEVMARALKDQHEQLAEARAERLGLMKRMLPSTVAERLAAGDPQSLEEAPDASVAVLALVGLDAARGEDTDHPTIDDSSTIDTRRAGLEELFGQLDELARHHGLEPIKIIGDEYYAACGHERPYIDHAPRTIAFAADAFDLVHDSDLHADGGLELSAGVASGAVTVGLSGTSRLVYDVWGVTVRRADHLARRAGPGRLLASDESAAKLPDTIQVTEFERITGQMSWIVDHDRAGDRS